MRIILSPFALKSTICKRNIGQVSNISDQSKSPSNLDPICLPVGLCSGLCSVFVNLVFFDTALDINGMLKLCLGTRNIFFLPLYIYVYTCTTSCSLGLY